MYKPHYNDRTCEFMKVLARPVCYLIIKTLIESEYALTFEEIVEISGISSQNRENLQALYQNNILIPCWIPLVRGSRWRVNPKYFRLFTLIEEYARLPPPPKSFLSLKVNSFNDSMADAYHESRVKDKMLKKLIKLKDSGDSDAEGTLRLIADGKI